MIPRIIQSFCSDRCNDFQLFMYTCYFTVSCLFAKKADIDLSIHTDEKFADQINIAPYKNIYIDLDNCYSAPREFFAYAKLKAFEHEPLGTIHIDGDVFLKKNSILDMLRFDDYDCIVQHLELEKCMEFAQVWNDTDAGYKNIEYMPYMERKFDHMYNCGVLGFNNEKLFEDWYNGYFTMLERVKESDVKWLPAACPDIIIEQKLLTDLCDFNNYNVKTLFVLNDLSEKDAVDAYAYDIGYQHVVCDKVKDIPTCLKVIHLFDKSIYNEIKMRWGQVFPQIFEYSESLTTLK